MKNSSNPNPREKTNPEKSSNLQPKTSFFMFFASIRTSFSVNKQKKAWMNVATANHPHIHKLNPQTQNYQPLTINKTHKSSSKTSALASASASTKTHSQTQNQWPQTTGISKFTNKHIKLKPTKLLHTHRKPKFLMPIQTKTGQQKTQIL